ncbi:MAG: hypothetical protein ACLSB9_18835 [Hydrogeniiclostridium mannosilyticum]
MRWPQVLCGSTSSSGSPQFAANSVGIRADNYLRTIQAAGEQCYNWILGQMSQHTTIQLCIGQKRSAQVHS